MLVFEVRGTEKSYFENENFEGYNITYFEECLNEEFVENLSNEHLENTNVISIAKDSAVSEDVINKFKNLRIMSIRTEDYDQVCISNCEEKNIAVINISQADTLSAAQFTIGLIINLVRNISAADKMLRVTKEFNEDFIGRDLSKLTLGVIGTSHVGAEICCLADALGMNIVATDSLARHEIIEKYNIEYLPVDELAQKADVISVNIEYTTENYHMFNDEFFSKCKDGVYFVSISKSELIDYEALHKYVDNGKIKGVALDTAPCDSICYHCKNLTNKLIPMNLECLEQTNYIDKLKKYDNVIITPCLASHTKDSSEYILEKTMQCIKETLNGGRICRIV